MAKRHYRTWFAYRRDQNRDDDPTPIAAVRAKTQLDGRRMLSTVIKVPFYLDRLEPRTGIVFRKIEGGKE